MNRQDTYSHQRDYQNNQRENYEVTRGPERDYYSMRYNQRRRDRSPSPRMRRRDQSQYRYEQERRYNQNYEYRNEGNDRREGRRFHGYS